MKFKDCNVGVITNYFSQQFLKRDNPIFEVPYDNFVQYLNVNKIDLLIIDNDLYEADHTWFGKEISGIIANCKLNNIDIVFIKNSEKPLNNQYKGFPIINIVLNKVEVSQKFTVNIPLLIDESLFNPIKTVKTMDVIYFKKGKILRPISIQKFNSLFNAERKEIAFTEITKKIIFDLIELLKITKCLYIYEPQDLDPYFLKYLELIATLQNVVVLYDYEESDSKYAVNNNVNLNVRNMFLFKQEQSYRDKYLIPLQRDILINHTFIFYDKIEDLIITEGIEKKAYISVITSTNRKHNIPRYMKQLGAQSHVKLQVILVTHGFILSNNEIKKIQEEYSHMEIIVLDISEHLPLGYCLNTAIAEIKYDYVAKVDDDDYYFKYYLIDAWLAAKYSNADLVGKLSTFTHFEGSNLTISKHKNTRQKYNPFVMGATFFAKSSLMKKYMFSYLKTGEDSDFLRKIKQDNALIYADHPYNFCIFRSDNLDAHTWKITDIEYMRNSNIERFDRLEDNISF